MERNVRLAPPGEISRPHPRRSPTSLFLDTGAWRTCPCLPERVAATAPSRRPSRATPPSRHGRT